MSVLLLISPFTHEVTAELKPDEEIIVYDQRMKDTIDRFGIAVYPEFKKKYNVTHSRIFPHNGASLFARAFEHCYFVHGLQQQGFKWRDKSKHFSITGLSDREIAEKILEIYKREIAAKSTAERAYNLKEF